MRRMQRLAAAGANRLGLPDVYGFVRRKLTGSQVTIVMYHHILEKPNDKFAGTISPQVFESQVNYLRQNYQMLSLDKLVQCLLKEKRLPEKAVVITFDDGGQDSYSEVYPILKKYNLPATIFLTTGHITSARNQLTLSWEDVREMSRNGIDFGAHCVTHTNLTTIPLEQARWQIGRSKQDIQMNIGKVINLFAYPYGASNPEIVRMVREAGFIGAVAVDPVWISPMADPYKLGRVMANEDSNKFKVMLCGFLGDLPNLLRRSIAPTKVDKQSS